MAASGCRFPFVEVYQWYSVKLERRPIGEQGSTGLPVGECAAIFSGIGISIIV